MPSHHLILGGQRSGKSRHAERLARAWLEQDARHEVMVVATALAGDDEMRERIERHRRDRDASFRVVESPLLLGQTLREHARQALEIAGREMNKGISVHQGQRQDSHLCMIRAQIMERTQGGVAGFGAVV